MGLLKRVFGADPELALPVELPLAPARDLGRPCPEMPVYVIGDIHGRLDLFEDLLSMIDLDLGADEIDTPMLVCLGDYIDRGEDSAGVLARLHGFSMAQPDHFICLLGNHELMMLEFLQKQDRRRARWLKHGGLQTLASFGIGGVTHTAPLPALELAARQLREALPDGLETWMRRLPKVWKSGSLVCAHAAVDPALPIRDQSRHTLLWGHPDFLETPRSDGLWVAHGHTAFPEPRCAESRISLDTEAYISGRLSAARVMPDGSVKFLWT